MTESFLYPTNDVVHQRVRLGILTIANETRRVEFGFLQDAMNVTPGNLSQHIRILEDSGLVCVEKGQHGRRPRTWVSLTKAGRIELNAEIKALKSLVHRVEQINEVTL